MKVDLGEKTVDVAGTTFTHRDDSKSSILQQQFVSIVSLFQVEQHSCTVRRAVKEEQFTGANPASEYESAMQERNCAVTTSVDIPHASCNATCMHDIHSESHTTAAHTQ